MVASKKDAEPCCLNNCDEYCAVGVDPDDPPAVTCCETCTSVLYKCHWWTFAFFLNLGMAPIILTYHAVMIYLIPCIWVKSTRSLLRRGIVLTASLPPLQVYLERSCGCLIKSCCQSLCCEFCWHFTDKDFPPNFKSLGETEKRFARGERDAACCCPGPHETGGDVQWLRPDSIKGFDKSDGKLFTGGIEAEDIAQGQLGNCWLLAAIATLAEHDGAVEACFVSRQHSATGSYTTRCADPNPPLTVCRRHRSLQMQVSL